MAEKIGLIPGLAMDLAMCDERGNPRGSSDAVMRSKAKKIVFSKAALLLIVSPMCSAFSKLQTFNLKRLGEARVKEMLEIGIKHLSFAMSCARFKEEAGYTFSSSIRLEPPAGALAQYKE